VDATCQSAIAQSTSQLWLIIQRLVKHCKLCSTLVKWSNKRIWIWNIDIFGSLYKFGLQD